MGFAPTMLNRFLAALHWDVVTDSRFRAVLATTGSITKV